jgi:hypothetical protein
MENARMAYLDAGEGSADEKLERVVGRLFDPDARKAFYEAYKDIEALWEILSPSPELRDHIESYKNLAKLYAAVRNAYAPQVGYIADLAYKTRRLVEEGASQEGLGRLTKTVTFDVKTLEGLRNERGSDEGKVFSFAACITSLKRSRRPRRCCGRSPRGPTAFSRSWSSATSRVWQQWITSLPWPRKRRTPSRRPKTAACRPAPSGFIGL